MSFLKQARRSSLCFLITALLLGASASQAAVNINENEYLVFYHHDALGSPAATTNEKGQILSRESSKPFGGSVGKTSSDGNPLVEGEGAENESRIGYTGHSFDGGSELVYMKARFYDPAIGRFYSNDPVGFNTGNLMMFNRYAYGNNNPYKYVDPYGEMAFLAWFATPPGLAALGTAANWTAGAMGLGLLSAAAYDHGANTQRNESYDSDDHSGDSDQLAEDSSGTLPDDVFSDKAPKNTVPGTDTLTGIHVNDRGGVLEFFPRKRT